MKCEILFHLTNMKELDEIKKIYGKIFSGKRREIQQIVQKRWEGQRMAKPLPKKVQIPRKTICQIWWRSQEVEGSFSLLRSHHRYLGISFEDYRWWWTSFSASGSSGIYVFLYSIMCPRQRPVFFSNIESTCLAQLMLTHCDRVTLS